MSAVRLLPWALHEAVEYLAGIFLVIAPFALGFSSEGSATRVFVGVGVGVLVVAGITRGPLGVVGLLPARLHAGIDYLLGFLLILGPFLFGFADVEQALYAAVLLGVAHLVLTLLTRFPLRAAHEAGAPEAGGAPSAEA